MPDAGRIRSPCLALAVLRCASQGFPGDSHENGAKP